jgi:hypothetical protein
MSPFLVVRQRPVVAAALLSLAAAAPGLLHAQAASAPVSAPVSAPAVSPANAAMPPRAIRRDVPITNSIRRAYAAGTRDSTGRPGRNYWQLRTDYAIDVSLDAAASRLTGTARITLHNSSPDPLRDIGLRLDPNHFQIGRAHV